MALSAKKGKRMKLKMGLIVLAVIINIFSVSFISAQETGQEVNVEKESALLKVIKQKQKRLLQKEQLLKEEEKHLEAIRADILKKLIELKQLKKALDTYFQRLKKLEDNRYNQLARIYEATPPQEAAQRIGELDPIVAAQIMLRMDKRKAGKIWGYIDPKIASKITEEIVKLR